MNYTFTLTQDQLNVIATALNELPHKLSRSVIDDLQRQFVEQQPKQAETTTDEKND